MWLIRPELISVSVAWSDSEYFYSLLDGMLVHCRVTPSIKFASTYLYTWVERCTMRVKCLAQEHNTMSPARAWTQTAHSRVKCTNHEATVPPTLLHMGVPTITVTPGQFPKKSNLANMIDWWNKKQYVLQILVLTRSWVLDLIKNFVASRDENAAQ